MKDYKIFDTKLGRDALFKYGFVCYAQSEKPNLDCLKGWNRTFVSKYVIFSHPAVSLRVLDGLNGTVVLLGEAFATSGVQSVDDILDRFLNVQDWDAVDAISGRFALFLFSESRSLILNDAFGSQTIYYCLDGRLAVSSHSAILANLFDYRLDPRASEFIKCPEYKQRGATYLPGDLTMYKEVVGLAPNNYVDLKSGKTVRYWPRATIPVAGMDAFLECSDEYFSALSRFLKTRYRAVLGLTAGVDSRAVIAGLRHYGTDLRLVTWDRLPDEDAPAVEAMRMHLNVPHGYVKARAIEDTQKFRLLRSVSNLNSGYCRGPATLTAAMAEVSQPKDIFIRGLGGEIMRGFYNRHKTKISAVSAREFTRLYLTNRVRAKDGFFHDFAHEAFKCFMERANYRSEFFNLDPLDLFYWEHRMGMWAANLLNEMDAGIYNFVGMNSRQWFALSFGLPSQVRLGQQLLLDITARYDKDFAGIGV